MHTSPVLFVRLLINNRRLWIPCMALLGLCTLSVVLHQSDSRRKTLETFVSTESTVNVPESAVHSLTFDEVKHLLDQLFDSQLALVHIQSIWNQLFEVWREILHKFVRDACQYCHRNESYCHDSIDIDRYVYYINESFYPINEIKRPVGMGIFYYFDLKTLRSVNNSILPTDVSSCDYFHMLQLMINVQIVLHQAQIKYFLTKGTLIGVLRHHDVIPWDTDIDLFIPASATTKILRSFRQLDAPPTQPVTTTTTTTTTTTENPSGRLSKE